MSASSPPRTLFCKDKKKARSFVSKRRPTESRSALIILLLFKMQKSPTLSENSGKKKKHDVGSLAEDEHPLPSRSASEDTCSDIFVS